MLTKITYLNEEQLYLPTTKTKFSRRVTLYIFANPFNVWLNRSHVLGKLLCTHEELEWKRQIIS